MQTGMTYEDFVHYAEETQDLGGATVVRKISRNWFNEEVRRSGLLTGRRQEKSFGFSELTPGGVHDGNRTQTRA